MARHAEAPGDAIPPPQAQACLLLQKALPIRELRLCFEDPEWEQLIGQILTKVTEVMPQLLPHPHQEASLGTKEQGFLGPCASGWVCGCPRRRFFPWGFSLWCGKWFGGHFLCRTCGRWVRRRPSQRT